MADFPFALVGFDLDGTLVDSTADLAGGVNHALAVAGLTPLAIDEVRPLIGGGARQLLERALAARDGDAGAVDRLFPLMIAHYTAHMTDHTRPFPGVVTALDALAARGVWLAVVTNKLEHLSVLLLARLGLAARFDAVIGSDTVGMAKPDPAPIREMLRRGGGGPAAFVGDSRYDVEAARAAGIPVALFDPRGDSGLAADATFAHYDALVATLAHLRSAGDST